MLDPLPTEPRIWVLADDAEVAAPWGKAIQATGLIVVTCGPHTPNESFDFIVAILNPQTADETLAVRLGRFADRYPGRVIPVSLGDRAANVVPLLSHTVVAGRPVEAVARALAGSLAVGGKNVVAFNDLLRRARAWIASGRDPRNLLSGDRAKLALRLLAMPMLAASAGSDEIRALVAASDASQRLRRRRQTLFAAAAALVLLVGAAAALWQGREAQIAAAMAKQQTDVNTSVRLAGLAQQAIDGDPDRPWLLATAALAAAVTPEARGAAISVLDRIPPHVTVPLDGQPLSVSASADAETLAVGLADGRVQIFNSSGEPLWTVAASGKPAGQYEGSVVLSGDGRLLLDTTGTPRMVDLAARVEKPVDGSFLSAGSPAVWLDGTRFAAAKGGTLAIIDADGSAEPADLDSGLGEIVRLRRSPAGTQVLVLTESHWTVWDANSEPAAVRGLPDDYADLGFLDDDRLIIARRANMPLTLDLATPDEVPREVGGPVGSRVFPGPDDSQLFINGGRLAIRLTTGQIAMDFPASQGNLVGAAELANGGLATVGGDSQLRLWKPALPSIPLDNPVTQPTATAPVPTTESNRVMIARSGEAFGISLPYPNPRVAVLDDDLALVSRSDYPDPEAAVRPTHTRDRFGIFTVLGVIQMSGSGKQLWAHEFEDLTGSESMVFAPTGSNADGTTLAFATRLGWIRSYRRDAEPRETRLTGQPLRVFVRADDTACVITVSGQLECEDGTRNELTSDSLAAAEPLSDGRIILVTTSGAVLEWNRIARPIATTAVAEIHAVRMSPSGHWVAIIGREQTDVVELSTGLLGGRHTRVGLAAAVSDVAFVDDQSYVIVYSTGAVSSEVLSEPEAVLAHLWDGRPRDVTADELRTYQFDPALLES